MKIKVLTNVDVINGVANLPEVLPFIGPNLVSIDLGDLLNLPSRYLFLSNEEETAISLWEMYSPGIWEGHTMFTNQCRGRQAIQTGRAMIDTLHEIRPVMMIWGQTPVSNRAANWFNSALGMKRGLEITHHVMGPEYVWFYSRYFDPLDVMAPHRELIEEMYNREAQYA